MVTIEANKEDILFGFSYIYSFDEEGNPIERLSIGFFLFSIHWWLD